jgi:hypothetical protein
MVKKQNVSEICSDLILAKRRNLLSLTHRTKIQGLFFLTSDRASKKVRNAREPDLRVA